MKASNSLIVVVVGLLILWLGVTGKFDCFGGVLTCMLSKSAGTAGATGSATGATQAKGSALGRVTQKLGALNGNETLSLEYWLRGAGTPPFVG